MNLRFVLILGLIGLAFQSYSRTYEVSVTTNLAIPDGTYNGTLASMASVPLSVPINETIQDINVTLAVSHTFIGDLVIKVKNPVGTVVTLMSRPGVVEPADDGTSFTGNGDSSNLSTNFPITFDDSAVVSAETMGSTILDSQTVCTDDGICLFIPNPGAATSGNLGSFNGGSASGIWTLYVGDAGALDTGTITAFTLTIVAPDGPRLQIFNTGTNIVLTWPTNPPDYLLESAQPLQTNGWNTVTNSAVVVSGTNFTTTVSTSDTNRFFRLRKP